MESSRNVLTAKGEEEKEGKEVNLEKERGGGGARQEKKVEKEDTREIPEDRERKHEKVGNEVN